MKPYEVQWSKLALRQLASIRRYVAQDKPLAAAKLALRIRNSTNSLASFPHSGRIGRVPETREWIIPGTPYIATYAVSETEIHVLSIHHGMIDWAPKTESPK